MATFLRIFGDFSKSGVRYLGGMPGPISFLDELDHILIPIAFSRKHHFKEDLCILSLSRYQSLLRHPLIWIKAQAKSGFGVSSRRGLQAKGIYQWTGIEE